MTTPMKSRSVVRSELAKWFKGSGFIYKAGMSIKEVSDQTCADFPSTGGRNYFAQNIIAEMLLLNSFVIVGDGLKQAKIYKTFTEAIYLHN